jgi:hypothetical protein
LEIDWIHIHDNYDWLGHIAEASVMAVIVALIARISMEWRASVLVGMAFAIGHFHGREKRDHEIDVGMPPPHLDAYNFLDWNWDQATDFWPVAILFMLLMMIVARRWR